MKLGMFSRFVHPDLGIGGAESGELGGFSTNGEMVVDDRLPGLVGSMELMGFILCLDVFFGKIGWKPKPTS